MDISAQYLEGGTEARRVSPAEARLRLRDAFQRVPLSMVLLGWDLDPRVVEACADECSRHDCDLYLWQPTLTAHGAFSGDPSWYVVGLSGEPAAGLDGKPEFSFICPNRAEARERILQNLSEAIAGGDYQGVFLDRIRFPSPAYDLAGQFACFCDACRAVAGAAGLELAAVQENLRELLLSREGRRAAVLAMLAPIPPRETEAAGQLPRQMLEFRQRSVGRMVDEITGAAHAGGLKVGLDCFSPTLTRMVGQDLPTLAKSCDWIKVMTYTRAFAPASLPYEVVGLVNWLMSMKGETEQEALEWFAGATGWSLPRSLEAIRSHGLAGAVLTQELQRGRAAKPRQLLAGIELVEMPEVVQLSPQQIEADAEAVLAGAPDGAVFSWDLRRIPAERLELAASLYGDPSRR